MYFYLRSSTVYCQIVYNLLRSVAFSTSIKSKSKFDQDIQRFENDTVANLKLEEIKITIYNIELELITQKQSYNAEQLKSLFQIKYSPKKLTDVISDFAIAYEKNKKSAHRTIQTYNTRSNGLKAFLIESNNIEILIHEIDIEFVKNYENWLLFKKYLPSYCNKSLQYLNQLLVFGCKKKLILQNCMYLYKYLIHDKKSRFPFLTLNEVRKIEATHFESKKLIQVKNWFLFQCYTDLSYADMKIFNPKINIVVDCEVEWMQGDRYQSKSFYQLPLLPKAKEILRKYPRGFEIISNVNYNVYIKEIMQLCDLNKPEISSHSGRKTFGNYCIEQGCNLQTVSEMLGHRDTRMTARVYTDVHKSKILKDMVGVC